MNFSTGRQSILRSFLPKGKNHDYYHRTQRELGYISTPSITKPEFEEIAQTRGDSDTPSWDSDVSISAIFQALIANMTSINRDGSDEVIILQKEIWTKHMDTL